MIGIKKDMTNEERYILLTQYIDERYEAYAFVKSRSRLTAHGEGGYSALEDLEDFIRQLEGEE